MTGRETVGMIKGEGGEALAHRADASKAADVAAMIEACVSAYDRIDVLDNNVGIAEVGGLVEVSEADWDRVFAVNLKSAYLTMKQTIPLMVRQGGGSIINISSIASIRYTGVPYATYYASSDFARPDEDTDGGEERRPLRELCWRRRRRNVAQARPASPDGIRRRRLGCRLGCGLSCK